MDPFLALLLLKRYIAAAQVHLPDPARTDAKIRCLERLSTKADQAPFPVTHDHFGVLAGDTVQVVKCTRLKVKMRDTDSCYRDIPIHHPRWRFLDLENRVAKELSSERPCRVHFPIRVQGLFSWWVLDGSLRRTDPPKRWTGKALIGPTASHPDGLYTQAEVKEWEAVQAMPVYFQQLTGSIRLKSCSAALGCPQPAPTGKYNWQKLEEELPLSSMMVSMQTAWTWVGRIDQALVIVFVPVIIMLVVKVRRLEHALAPRQGGVNVAVSAPAVLPMQNLSTATAPPPTTDHLNDHDRLRERCYESFR